MWAEGANPNTPKTPPSHSWDRFSAHISQINQKVIKGYYIIKCLLCLSDYAWQTNLPGTSNLKDWEKTSDHKMLIDLWDSIDKAEFGLKININKKHATGFSSGGFMTSRMGFSYPGQFRSLRCFKPVLPMFCTLLYFLVLYLPLIMIAV
jgi:hypothetical protein